VRTGYAVDGAPVRVVVDESPSRFRVIPEQQPWQLEFVARDVPAFGWRRYRLTPDEAATTVVDEGRSVSTETLTVTVAADGSLTLEAGAVRYDGLFGFEDAGDRGDTYDFDGVRGDQPVVEAQSVSVTRSVHPSGIGELHVVRDITLPRALDERRKARGHDVVTARLVLDARVAPGVPRVDVRVRLDNPAEDHRFRLRFPLGATDGVLAATTFDAVSRSAVRRPAKDWVHPAPPTFPCQGWINAKGVTIVAPGLPEAEVAEDGSVLLTLLRSVGWLARMDLSSRPVPAGPGLRTPGAQCKDGIEAWISLALDGAAAVVARDAELGLCAVPAGAAPLVEPGRPLVHLMPETLVLSALKPADDAGFVLRVLNPTDEALEARVDVGFPVSSAKAVRLDETPAGDTVTLDGRQVRFAVPAHALRTVLLT
jgi:mannosylglycerate hydrolase